MVGDIAASALASSNARKLAGQMSKRSVCRRHRPASALSRSDGVKPVARAIKRNEIMSEATEIYYAEMEAARNSACDAYFEARPQIDRQVSRETFKAGFERA